jgi:hypothetical protein
MNTSKHIPLTRALITIVLALLTLSCWAQSLPYKVIFLGENTGVSALNNKGDVAVSTNFFDGQQYQTWSGIWSTNTGFTLLPFTNFNLNVNSLNDAGYLSGNGYVIDPIAGYVQFGVVYGPGEALVLTNGITPTYVWTNGDFTGTWGAFDENSGWVSHAVVGLQGQVFTLPEPAWAVQSSVAGASPSGIIVGNATSSDYTSQGVAWSGTNMTLLSDVVSGFMQIAPMRINANNAILFYGADTNGGWSSYLWDTTNLWSISAPDFIYGWPIDLNDRNQVLYTGYDANWSPHLGIMCNGTFTAINVGPNYQNLNGVALNDQGWIIAGGSHNDVWGGMVLIPCARPSVALSGWTNPIVSPFVNITATVTTDAPAKNVDLYVANQLCATATASPFAFPFYCWTNGTFDVFAIVYDDAGQTATSAVAQVVVDLPLDIFALSPPSNLRCYGDGLGANHLTWDVATNVASYRIERITADQANILGTAFGNATSYVDSTAPQGGGLVYRVIAVNPAGEATAQVSLPAVSVINAVMIYRGGGFSLLAICPGDVLRVDFFAGGTLLGSQTNAPFVLSSPNGSPTNLCARITDSEGNSRTVIVDASAANRAAEIIRLQVYRPN